MTHTKAKVVDTSTLIHDPFCLSYLTQAGAVACIPWTVLEELDGLKTRPDIGFDAREATRIIESLRSENHPHISIVRDTDWEGMEHIDRVLNDHIILAASRFLQKKIRRRDCGFEGRHDADQGQGDGDTGGGLLPGPGP